MSILRSHLIEADLLARDEYEVFFATREEALLQLIEDAMDKPIVRTAQEEEAVGDLVIEDDEEPEEDGAADPGPTQDVLPFPGRLSGVQ